MADSDAEMKTRARKFFRISRRPHTTLTNVSKSSRNGWLMPIKVTCPKCQGVLHAPDDAGGKKGKCPTCGTVLEIRPPGGPAPFGGGGMIPPEPEDSLAPTPFKAPSMTRAIPDETRRSSFGSPPSPPIPLPPTGPDARPFRGSSTGFGGAPLPDARKPGEPYTKPGRAPATVGAVEPTVRAWKRGRNGLWWCLLGYFFFFVALVAYAGLEIARVGGVKLPAAKPGFLKIEDMGQDEEIRLAAAVVPAVLGLLALTLGRLGAGSVPDSSFARGILKSSALCTLLTLLGLVAAAVMTVGLVVNGVRPTMLLVDETTGMIQHIGLAVAAVFAPLAELLFLIGLGRLGAGLQNVRLAGRATRVMMLISFGYVVAGLGSYAVALYGSEIRRAIADKVAPNVEKLGDKQSLIVPVLVLLAAVLIYAIYLRLLGAARLAIRDRLDSLT